MVFAKDALSPVNCYWSFCLWSKFEVQVRSGLIQSFFTENSHGFP
jgi:hypothetical protein